MGVRVFTFPMLDAVKSGGVLGVAQRVLTAVAVYPGMFAAFGVVFLTPYLLCLRMGASWLWVLAWGVFGFAFLTWILMVSVWNLGVVRSLTGKYSFDHLLILASAFVWLAVTPMLTAYLLGRL